MIIIDSVLFKQIEIFHFPRKWKSKKNFWTLCEQKYAENMSFLNFITNTWNLKYDLRNCSIFKYNYRIYLKHSNEYKISFLQKLYASLTKLLFTFGSFCSISYWTRNVVTWSAGSIERRENSN